MLIGIFGKIKPYKSLATILDSIIDTVVKNPQIKFLIAGQIFCRDTQSAIKKMPQSQVILYNKFIDDDQLNQYLSVCDFGLLSYQDILTSGSLFHSLSRGLPVIAPNKGTIPNYVCDDFNGYMYDDFQSLNQILESICFMSSDKKNMLAQNALETAKRLSWPRQSKTLLDKEF